MLFFSTDVSANEEVDARHTTYGEHTVSVHSRVLSISIRFQPLPLHIVGQVVSVSSTVGGRVR